MSNEIHYMEIMEIGINIHKIIRKTKKDISVFRRFYRLIKDYMPDAIHCWDSMTAIYVIPACKLLKCKLINGMVIDAPLKRNVLNKYWLRARLTFPFSDIIVSNSQAGLTAYHAQGRKSIVISSGFNFDRTVDLVKKESIKGELNIITTYTVGMVATFWENKDYPTYLNAACLVLSKRKDITFLAIGTDTESLDSLNLIGEENIVNFRLLGKISGVESYINIMDICILSTFTEGISNSILEYMAMGKPVIATRGGGTSEIVVDKETGFLVNPSDPGELAGKIEMLLDDPELRKRMGSSGMERVKREFSINKMVDKYIDLYMMFGSN